MAKETGTIKSISTDGKNAEIIKDSDGSVINYSGTPIPRSVDVGDGIVFENDNGTVVDVVGITKIKIKGTLTNQERDLFNQLVKEVNGREGNGGIDIGIKTKT